MEIISKNQDYPKTVLIRNRPDGMIWQIYHVKSERAAQIISKRAADNCFEGVTLEDHQPNMEETSDNWQNDFSTDVELRLLEGTNKIQYLLNKGLITLDDMKEYTQQYMDGVDQYDDEQINKYYQEQYAEQQCEQEDYYESTFPTQSLHPKYVIASTSLKLEETIVFECDEHGNRLSFDDYGCIAKRLGHIKMWAHRDIAVRDRLREHEYTWRKEFKEVDGCIQTLYERFDPEHFHEKTPEQRVAMVAIKYKNFVVC